MRRPHEDFFYNVAIDERVFNIHLKKRAMMGCFHSKKGADIGMLINRRKCPFVIMTYSWSNLWP